MDLNIPMVTKTGSIKTLIFRAYDLCTEIKDSNEELELLKDTFIANDFPININCRQDLSEIHSP